MRIWGILYGVWWGYWGVCVFSFLGYGEGIVGIVCGEGSVFFRGSGYDKWGGYCDMVTSASLGGNWK